MTRFRHAARLIPAFGLALALTIPAAGYGAPSPRPAAYADDDDDDDKRRNRGKKAHKQGHKRGKAHFKGHGKRDDDDARHRRIQRGQRHRTVVRERVIVVPRRQRVVARERIVVAPPRVVQRERVIVVPPRQRVIQRRAVPPPHRGRAPGWYVRDAGLRLGRFLEIEGRLTDESWECATMRDRNGRLFSLIGDLEGFDPGDRVEVAGRLVSGSGCPGTTIRVDDIRGDRRNVIERIFGDDDRDRRDDRDRGSLLVLHGRLATAGGCRVLRADDGRTYELAGDLRGYGRGADVRVVGVAEGGSRCGIGPAVRVGEISGR
jgi:hypothetical protein